MAYLNKRSFLFREFEGVKNKLLLDIRRNVEQGRPPVSGDEELFRIFCDNKFDDVIAMNKVTELSESQVDYYKHQYLNQIFDYLDDQIGSVKMMMTSSDKEILNQAIETFGNDSQIGMCIEECGELIAALNRHTRGRIRVKDVAGELADVCIMIEQMKLVFGCSLMFQTEFRRKMNRLKKMVGDNENL